MLDIVPDWYFAVAQSAEVDVAGLACVVNGITCSATCATSANTPFICIVLALSLSSPTAAMCVLAPEVNLLLAADTTLILPVDASFVVPPIF
jgi:hypothetical protein